MYFIVSVLITFIYLLCGFCPLWPTFVCKGTDFLPISFISDAFCANFNKIWKENTP